MEHLSSDMEQRNQVQWRRDKVQELCSKGYSQREISQTLQVGLATVNRDISYLRQQAKHNIIDNLVDKSKDKEKMESSNSHDKKESNKPNDEYKGRLEEKQEKEASEMTINQVF